MNMGKAMSANIRKYRPSNGFEGELFRDEFCCRCKRDINENCSILAATFYFNINDPNYPSEWIEDIATFPDTNPRCTAFEALDALPPAGADEELWHARHDPRQTDMFSAKETP
jgi:hypothetical protein